MLSHKRHKQSAKVILLSSTTDSIYLSSLVAVALEAGLSNVVGLPLSISPFQVKRNAFSNKAFNTTEINTEVKVLGLAKTLMVFMKTIYIN
jgi:electron transfer flavoprotein alpha subunit